MTDVQFFTRAGPFDLATIAEGTGAAPIEGADTARSFVDVAPLETAGPDDISFLDNKKYLEAFEVSRAGACFVEPGLADRAPASMTPLVCDQPYLALALATRMFYPSSAPEPGVSDTAHIDPSAVIGEGARIEHGVVISAGVQLGKRCHVAAGAVLYENIRLGDDCHVGAGATLMYCLIGDRVWIDTGVRVGTQGFGFAVGPKGAVRIPHTGRVLIGNDVEIGANTTVDRGTAGDTEISDGAMIDNQVQIAHNVKVGRGAILAGQVGLAGSSQVGDYAMIGGKSGVANHIKIGTGAKIGALSGAATDLEAGGTYLGQPAIPIKDFWRQQAAIRRLLKQSKRT
ncbi:MAG: UDP-3-O-(3-hydroxymyristoyl)glucosamine N-acyltransferase [Alphaproteobacteria bacterium]|nr:UDP-3-O-(3-hydroxymyristoyl)glucosamine N-acyltransferase [Rhodospirillaceae bacterium]MBT6511096.1 UDP-3-O-(3-hydroxymyristoyl)glucosamine N-acyltransferase [Rhodospirillaceae bacterium]MDG2481116.1 UDP-3-O-(3-hydroxymyristoyl)glucosamine N-acyltransferase [Alphaproteobacteria bacterium]